MLPGTDALRIKYQGSLPALLEKRTDLNADAIRTFVRRGTWSMPPFRPTEVTERDIQDIAAYLRQSSGGGALEASSCAVRSLLVGLRRGRRARRRSTASAAEIAHRLAGGDDRVAAARARRSGARQARARSSERYRALEPLIVATHDLPYIAEFALRRQWGSLAEDDRQRFVAAFQRLSVMTYAARFGNVARRRVSPDRGRRARRERARASDDGHQARGPARRLARVLAADRTARLAHHQHRRRRRQRSRAEARRVSARVRERRNRRARSRSSSSRRSGSSATDAAASLLRGAAADPKRCRIAGRTASTFCTISACKRLMPSCAIGHGLVEPHGARRYELRLHRSSSV